MPHLILRRLIVFATRAVKSAIFELKEGFKKHHLIQTNGSSVIWQYCRSPADPP
jgi:hypothetical protein